MPVLIQINSVAGVKIAFEKTEFCIGRGEESDLRIDDDLVSRKHAIIDCTRKSGDATHRDWILRDQSSTNGTFVNDRRITIHALVDGDILRVGKTFLKFFSADNGDLGETRVIKKSFIPGVYYTTPKS